MKAYVRTIAAALVFIALAIYIFTSERGRVPEKEEVFGLQTSAATALKVQQNDEDPLVLQRRDDTWYISEPFSGLANQDKAVERIEAITQLKPKGTRTGVDLQKDEFGLSDPTVTATLWYHGGNSAVRVMFGKSTPVGSNRYARIGEREELYIVPESVYNTLTGNPDNLREKRIARYELQEIQSFTVSYDDMDIRLENRPTGDEDQWMLTQPVQARADEFDTEQYLRDLSNLEAETFPGDNAAGDGEYGFEPGWLTVGLNAEDGDQTTVTFGDTFEGSAEQGEMIYVRDSSRSEIMAVPFQKVKQMRRQPIEFRDRAVVDVKRDDIDWVRVQSSKKLSFVMKRTPQGWQLDKPQPGPAKSTKADDIIWDLVQLEAVDYVSESPDDLREYGLAVPQAIIQLRTVNRQEPIEIRIGSQRETDRSYFCQTSESQQVVAVGEMLMNDLPATIDDIRAEPE